MHIQYSGLKNMLWFLKRIHKHTLCHHSLELLLVIGARFLFSLD
jgi:hypothetical protein